MFTHQHKRSGRKCFRACTYPLRKELQGQEKAYPLMHFKDGQITRVNANNLKRVPVNV
mgnify:CR=1 FL=1